MSRGNIQEEYGKSQEAIILSLCIFPTPKQATPTTPLPPRLAASGVEFAMAVGQGSLPADPVSRAGGSTDAPLGLGGPSDLLGVQLVAV